MKSDEVGTTLKHPETINSNVKNLSKSIFHFLYYHLILLNTTKQSDISLFGQYIFGNSLMNPIYTRNTLLLVFSSFSPWLEG